jgi:MFS family permease
MRDERTPAEIVAGTAQTVAGAPSLLRNRAFLLLWLAQVFSQVAQNALILGLLVLVQRLTQSPTHLSIATFALVLPSVLFSMLAGVVVDHLNKKTVLVAANVLRALAAMLYLSLDSSLGLIYLVSFLFSTVGQFFSPAEAAAIPMLVRKENLISANALFNLTLSGSQLIGLVIAAPLLIKLVGINGFFVTLAVLFVLAAVCVAFLPRDDWPVAGLTGGESKRMLSNTWAELQEGWRILRSDDVASLALVYLTLMASLIPLLAVLGPVFAVGVIRAGAEDVVYLFAPAGVAMVVGAVVVGKLVGRMGKLRLATSSLIVMGLTLVALGAAKTGGGYLLYNLIGRVLDTRQVVFELVPIVMALSFILGLTFAFVAIPAQTLLQERCPADFRGRIFGVQFTLSGAGSILPLLGAGGFADLFGVNKTIVLLGAALCAIGLAIMRRLRLMTPTL